MIDELIAVAILICVIAAAFGARNKAEREQEKDDDE